MATNRPGVDYGVDAAFIEFSGRWIARCARPANASGVRLDPFRQGTCAPAATADKSAVYTDPMQHGDFRKPSSKDNAQSSLFRAMTSTNGNLLEVRNLRTCFDTEDGEVKAVDGVTFQLKRGETLGIVGESGSGKSVTNLSIIRLIPEPPGKIVSGEVIFNGQDLLLLPTKEVRKIRGRRIAMIFQDPMT